VVTQQEIDPAVDTLSAPCPERTARTLQTAMRASTNPTEPAEAIRVCANTIRTACFFFSPE